jgi:hypothetical protein
MSKLMMHANKDGQIVTREDLRNLPVPAVTETYQPVSHFLLIEKLLTLSQDLLTHYTLETEEYGIARKGEQLFGVLSFKNSNPEMGLSIGVRNSYDKSLSIGLTLGANVFVCDNLAFNGSTVLMRKHTLNVWSDLELLAVSHIYKANQNFQKIIENAESFKQRSLTDETGFEILGRLFGHDVLSSRQLTVAFEQWKNPAHKDFQPRNLWSLYNGCTEALKTTPPNSIIDKYSELHKKMEIIDAEIIS